MKGAEIIKAQAGIRDSDDTNIAGEKLGRAIDALFERSFR